jgi:hypothetical protein
MADYAAAPLSFHRAAAGEKKFFQTGARGVGPPQKKIFLFSQGGFVR